ncbi:unnamed protein product [Vitrella brassicaformis CCMP3155]|uniref:Uncharacterized protein n=2 Tax=Vitrella brassicaformis TaxID=1169539 RepID=A0A0G4GWL9_VITBC|nr:unnamed protein product [Vitrella brassicaformis CCMP3155]|mmetsp:Transcript_48681/g.121862  ORF Transcript_48681/g.121862 Transcript_48681/m.121862 type:complete len:117 (+) Transcript_48681:297-647(+)|eukprot:CEM35147.1 unnamed protein product [Vitrella brassicaformis CCMP3155]
MKLFLCLVGALLVAGVAADMKHPPCLRKLQESTAVTDPSTEVTVPEESEITPGNYAVDDDDDSRDDITDGEGGRCGGEAGWCGYPPADIEMRPRNPMKTSLPHKARTTRKVMAGLS